jgi:hypothetical protein
MPKLVYYGWFASINGSDIAAAVRALEKVRGGRRGLLGENQSAAAAVARRRHSQHWDHAPRLVALARPIAFLRPAANLWPRAVDIATVIRTPAPRLWRTR